MTAPSASAAPSCRWRPSAPAPASPAGTSCSRAARAATPTRHGTFDDVIRRLPHIRGMGFDVLYFPPIHPIGRAFRKGRNNTLTPAPDDPGSPYAIGSEEGGHDAIHPQLGTLEDFRRLVAAARRAGAGAGARFRHPVQPGPSLAEASTATGSTGGRTARSATPRTRRRSTRTSSTSISTTRARCPRCGSRCATWCASGSSRACGCSGSTTRTPSPSPSGNG